MNCKKCGYLITNQDKTCPNCGEVNEFYVEGINQNVVPAAPVAPTEPVAPVVPETPVAPVEPVAPVVPEVPVTPVEQPVVQPTSVIPETPVAPVEPVMPEVPVTPVVPETPVEPSAPVSTSTPAILPDPAAPAPELNMSQTQVSSVASTTANKPKKNALFVIMVIVLSLVVVGLGVFIGFKLLSGNNETTDNVENNEPVTPVPVEKKTTMKYAGIEFVIPEGLTKYEENKEVFLIDDDKTFIIGLNGVSNTYKYDQAKTEVMSKSNEFKTAIESKGGTFINVAENTSYGRKYVTVSYVLSDIYYDEIFTELDGGILFYGYLAYKPSSKDTSYKYANEFLSSGKVSSAGTFASNITDDNMKAINIKTVTKIK